MRQMKDSGIEWIGEIPESWNLSRYKFFTDNRMGETILASETVETGIPVYSATQEDKLFGYVSSAKLILQKNDFVIPARGNSIGCVSIVKEDIATCTQTTICSKNIHGIDLLYLYYCCWGLKSEWFKYEGSAIPQISVEQVKNNIVPIPPKEEQQKISAYLDRQCGLIDSVIEKTKASIEEYKKLRQAVITQAVTKGVRGDRPMKDSGIEWIGEIPEEWKIVKLKRISIRIGDGLHSTPEYDENGDYYFLNGNNIGSDMLIFKENTDRLNEAEYLKYKPCVLTDNTVLITLNGATFGKTSFYNNEKVLLGKSAGYITLKNEHSKKFLRYYLASIPAKIIMDLSLNGTTIANLSLTTLNNFTTPLPCIEEQNEIAAYLDKKCTEIDSLISKKEQFLTELEAYKKSLIYEYVTGKKEVPQA